MQDNTSAPRGLITSGGMLAGLCVHQLPATIQASLSPSHIQHGGGGSGRVLQQHGEWAVIHYVDEFLLLGTHVHSTECQQALATTLVSCEELGVPDKTEGPSTTITFLGIQRVHVTPCGQSAQAAHHGECVDRHKGCKGFAQV